MRTIQTHSQCRPILPFFDHFSYAIDDEAPTSSPLPPALVPNQAAPKTLLFHADGLSAGAHTLTVNVTNVADASSALGIEDLFVRRECVLKESPCFLSIAPAVGLVEPRDAQRWMKD